MVLTDYCIIFSYPYSNEVSYGSPYGYSASVTPQQTMGYDGISADFVDSTTTYEPRSTIIDSDFIGHSEYCLAGFLLTLPFTSLTYMMHHHHYISFMNHANFNIFLLVKVNSITLLLL